jgi:two-component system response regulator
VERGARNVTLQSIEKLAEALEISVSTLLAYQRDPAPEGGAPQEFGTEGLVDILYVEDNEADIGLATEGLKNVTNRVHVVRDGQAALHFLFGTGEYANRRASFRPQLILLDLGLPKVDGLEVLRRVKSDERTAKIPVVVLTASARDRDLQQSQRLGAEAYIVKPVDLKNLSQVTPQLKLQWALLRPAPSRPSAPAAQPPQRLMAPDLA